MLKYFKPKRFETYKNKTVYEYFGVIYFKILNYRWRYSEEMEKYATNRP
jgi:hypothetical protein